MTPSIDAYRQTILPLRRRADVRNRWLKQRLDDFLPTLMQRENFDMWIVIAREYNEDAVVMTMLPEPAMSARRRTILVFTRQDDGTVERLTLSRYEQKGYYERVWNVGEETQYECLARIVKDRDPQRIGVNVSDTFAFGDGMTHNEYQHMAAALGDTYMQRTESAERLCVGWLEHRTLAELDTYPRLVEIGHAIIAEAFSSRVITPGVTTTDDVVWWMRQTMLDMGLQAWFQPSVEIQAHGLPYDIMPDVEQETRDVILPGDLLHCDVGFYYLGLATDQQQHAYVLRRGETDAPAGLKNALKVGNRLQDIHMDAMQVGRTGNDVLHAALQQAQDEGIHAAVYSHPLGYHGHAAGPTIGLWDMQGGVPGRGDYELFDQTAYSIELNIKTPVPEWDNQLVQIALEEDAALVDGEMHWLHGRQTDLYLIK